MDSVKFITTNWQLITLILGASGGSGWLGWLFATKSRKIDLYTKVFKMNSEMIDSVKSDFTDRVDFLKELNKELDEMVQDQQKFIKELREELEKYIKKYGKINETKDIHSTC